MEDKDHQTIGVYMAKFIDTLTIDERTKYDTYTKEQVYEAFVLEEQAKNKALKDYNRLKQVIAKIRFDIKEV